MIKILLAAALLLAASGALSAASAAVPRTLRVDYYHSGDASQEHFSLDRIVLEPGEWPGNPAHAIDDSNLGQYLFKVLDRQTNRVLYSRGFSSIYGEWETTPEAKEVWRTFSESLRFPVPAGPVQVVLEKRDGRNAFREVWSLLVDLKDPFIDSSAPPSPGPLLALERHGPSADKVDFLILGDGYTAMERGKCEKDARRLVEALFATSPFKERRHDFNVWGLCPAAAESGISRPSAGLYRRSPIGATYDAFGTGRYVLTFDNRALRDAAAFAPYEFVEILTNSQAFGGGGIFGLFSTVAADSVSARIVFVHEFGHHFAGLADEYYTSEVAYEPPAEPIEPWEPNVTTHADRDTLKWRDLVAPDTPLPTPWSKAEFEKRAADMEKRRREMRAQNLPEPEMEAVFLAERKIVTKLLAASPYAGKVGAFEGASYQSRGYYRPQTDCIMFTRDQVLFCRVCQRAIERVIDLYSRPAP